MDDGISLSETISNLEQCIADLEDPEWKCPSAESMPARLFDGSGINFSSPDAADAAVSHFRARLMRLANAAEPHIRKACQALSTGGR